MKIVKNSVLMVFSLLMIASTTHTMEQATPTVIGNILLGSVDFNSAQLNLTGQEGRDIFNALSNYTNAKSLEKATDAVNRLMYADEALKNTIDNSSFCSQLIKKLASRFSTSELRVAEQIEAQSAQKSLETLKKSSKAAQEYLETLKKSNPKAQESLEEGPLGRKVINKGWEGQEDFYTRFADEQGKVMW